METGAVIRFPSGLRSFRKIQMLSRSNPNYAKPGQFPLTDFLCRLFRMTNEELVNANPFRAARTFKGVHPNTAAYYINGELQSRGLPKLEWKDVDNWEPIKIDPPYGRRITGPGTSCEHGLKWPSKCSKCENDDFYEALRERNKPRYSGPGWNDSKRGPRYSYE